MFINGNDENHRSEAAYQFVTKLFALNAQPDAISSRFAIQIETSDKFFIRNVVQAVSAAWSNVVGILKIILQSISNNLWALLSSYLNLKEWSLKGKISTPHLFSYFGIGGSAELGLTFTKKPYP
jgi:hypothetical protein